MNTKISTLIISFVVGFSAFTNTASAQYAVPTCNSATIYGDVETNGVPTEVWFEWGQGGSISWSTSPQIFSHDSSFNHLLSNLQANTTYSYRAMAENQYGKDTGQIHTFTTASCGDGGQQQQQPTASITADNTNLNYNNSTTVRWSSTNATSCTASGGANNWAGTRLTSGSIGTSNLTNTVTYSITCTNSAGSASDSVTINVGQQQQPQSQPTVTISADNTNLQYNGATTVRWSSNHATSCTGTGGANGWSGSKGLSGSFATGALTNSTSFNITCSNNVGSASDSVIVNVGQQQQQNQPTVSLTADNTNLQYNGATTVRWTSSNANNCNASGGTNSWSGSKGLSGSFATGNLTNSVTYSITCTNSVGSASDSVQINVGQQQQQQQQNQPSVDIRADDTNISYNNSTVVRWTSSNANNCNASGGTNNWSGSKGLSGSFHTGNLTHTVTYSITCSNNNGSDSDSVTIHVSGQDNNNNQRPNVDIWADNTNVNYNNSTVIRWTSSNANYCNASGGTNNWSGNRSASGSFNTGSMTYGITFSINCYNDSGSSYDSVFISVTGQSQQYQQYQNPTVSLTADQYNIPYNGNTIVRWYSTNAYSCTASGGTSNWPGNRGTSGGFHTGTLTQTTTFYISCTNNVGSAFDSVTITVSGQPTVYKPTPYYPTYQLPVSTNPLLTLASTVDVIGCTCQVATGYSGDEVIYTVSYQNTTAKSVKNLKLQVMLPQETTFVSSAPYSPNVSGNSLTFNLGTIGANSQGAVIVRARVRDNIAQGTNLLFSSTMNYSGTSGQTLTANDSISTQSRGNQVASYNNSPQVQTTANASGIGMLTGGVLGWLALIVLVLLIIILVKHLITQSQKKTVITTTTP